MVLQCINIEGEVNIDVWQESSLTTLIQTLQGPSDQERAERRRLTSPSDLSTMLTVRDWELDVGLHVQIRKHLIPVSEGYKAESILVQPAFRGFAQDHKSCSLLIQGDTKIARITPISGVTLFSSTLYHSLAAHPTRFRPLVFFCGNHTFETVPSSGGAGIFRCLILQLLQLEKLATSDIPRFFNVQKIEEGDMEALCKVFILLVKQLRGDLTLFCIIDGVNYYENTPFEYGMRCAVDALINMAEDHDIEAAVKVLVTSVIPTQAIGTHPNFESGLHVLEMAEMEKNEGEDFADDEGEKRPPFPDPTMGIRIAETFGL
ncbi:hypothetical protein F5X68DRAFT_265030 [Plectosphaerella plurivora]|uniref:Nephrocystin 3-like N-terminal domain-containing protein n=1 Tax=Plectosphaerella plurivora TaxID=936078 RepID=A0A9P8V353_9PEZI|nr:hypothetical protein F5X68DRAFT_265030 [Plectosphaerella plurivora]